MTITGKLAFAIAASAIGSAFQHGFHTGVLNNPQKVVVKWINETSRSRGKAMPDNTINIIWSTIAAIYCLGGAIGGLLVGVAANLFGLKWALVFNNILIFISAIILLIAYYAKFYELIIVARLILGINSGLYAGLCPMYLSEISPVANRGAISSLYQLIITISILLSQILGFKAVLGSENNWCFLFALVMLVPSIFQCITLPFCPQSPRYLLLEKGKEDEASKALQWLRKQEGNEGEINEMKQEAAAKENEPKVTWKDMFIKKSLRKPLIISLLIMLAQQFSGINTIIFYSNNIFQNAGLNDFWSSFATVVVGLVNVIMTVVSVILVDLLGRKTLLLIGFAGTTIFMILLAISIKFSEDYRAMGIICIIFVVGYIISFATGPGSVPWFLVTELFKQDARPKATSLAVFTNWLANTIVVLCFLPIKDLIGYFVFAIFIILQLIFLVCIIIMVPETKNKPIDEITKLFGD